MYKISGKLVSGRIIIKYAPTQAEARRIRQAMRDSGIDAHIKAITR